ncbi:MAG: hypothetical protein M1135_02965 [Candidatus Omnitrophica bacterium]|nr:hypothetical protein [Candidatus Omnitrophota bacterium]
MIKGKMVKVRFKRYFPEQRMWVFVGKVLEFSENWVMVDGRGIITLKGQVKPADIDEKPRAILVPRENIAHIRILPDNFDISKMEIITQGTREYIKVEDGPNTSIGDAF